MSSEKELKKDADHRMKRAVENIQQEFAKIRTGRASPALAGRCQGLILWQCGPA